jgi:putative membrane protein
MKTKIKSASKMFLALSMCFVVRMNIKDEKFLIKASQANQAEIEFGKIALTRANSDSVKQMASEMIKDHQLAESDLLTICNQLSIQVPNALDSEAILQLQAIKNLSGKPFDAFYLNTENINHQLSTSLFKIEILEGSDSSAKTYARKYLPTLESHLKKFHNATSGRLLQQDSAVIH